MPRSRSWSASRAVSLGAAFWVLVAGADVAGSDLVITLREQASVAARPILLRDIADLDGLGTEWSGVMADVVVGRATGPGQTVLLRRADIQSVVEFRLPRALHVAWRGASTVRVEGTNQPLHGARLVDFAAVHLAGRLASDGAQVLVWPAETQRDVLVAPGEMILRARPLPGDGRPRKTMSVMVDVFVDGVFQRTVEIPLRVSVVRRAVRTNAGLQRGDAIRCEDLQEAVIELTELGAEPFTGACGERQWRLRRSLAAGDTLLAADVERTPEVVRGESVTLEAQLGVVQIQAQAVALSDGERGKTVRVRLASGMDAIEAGVVGPGLVRIAGR